MSSDPISPPLEPPAREPCPTPLSWQVIVQQVDEQAHHLNFQWEGGQVDGIELGAGPPLVFLPNATHTARMFALTAWLLRDDFRCVLLNPTTNTSHQSNATEAQNLGDALRNHFGGPYSLYGCGTGASLAIQLAAKFPETVHHLVLQGGGFGISLAWTERLMLQIGRWFQRPVNTLPLWQATQFRNHRPWFPPFDETRFAFAVQKMGSTRCCDVANRMLACSSVPDTSVTSAITCPTLILQCEGQGRSVNGRGEEYAHRIANAKLEGMHTAGMLPFLTHPHRLVKLLRSFLTTDN
ncbi:MAG: alpha/beta hydrolase [Planctomycetaceae bacterium]|nr:alpha/beta hydrolase [Planctomycetaceae bacterium]